MHASIATHSFRPIASHLPSAVREGPPSTALPSSAPAVFVTVLPSTSIFFCLDGFVRFTRHEARRHQESGRFLAIAASQPR